MTLTQPWANAVAIGLKRIETRSWRTGYRGLLAIHAAKGFPVWARQFAMTELALGRGEARIPRSAIVAIVRVIDCVPAVEAALDISAIERMYGDYSPGRWAWVTEFVERIEPPVPAKGALGLWEWGEAQVRDGAGG